ncbi:MAG TPA: FAD-dependent oxidoreductase [Polyangia bacterium]
MSRHRQVRVAIIGGGCAGLTTAFELTRPQHRGKYAVTVYQSGFRLGGKGASGRGPADRIEEHGLHLWMGFYENAFQIMRECYAELGRDPKKCRIAAWTDAFVPDHLCGVMDLSPAGKWSPWTVNLPAMPGLPGDPDVTNVRWTVAEYLRRSVTLARTLLETIRASAEGGREGDGSSPSPRVGTAPGELLRIMERLMSYGGLAGFGGLIEGLRVLDEVARVLPRFPRETILRFHQVLADAARAEIERMTAKNDGLRRLWEVAELVLATSRGIIRDGLVNDPRGFSAIDHLELRAWLKENGASDRALDSAFLRALYDLAFAYEDGDVSRPKIAAGQAVRGAVRAFFTYRGAFFWKMQSGMGDIVFAPLYEVLTRRGVTFEFFHRLENVGLGPPEPGQRPHVARLDFDVQARTRGGRPYRPLVDVRGLPCWPAEPDWVQLEGGAGMKREGRAFESHWDRRHVAKKTLVVGSDFDLVVLAVGVGAVPLVARELVETEPRWREMVAKVKSVPTQALQLWLRKDTRELGWSQGSINVSGYVEPFDTWADMPQLIREETFPTPVKSVAYFCSVLPDGSEKQKANADYPAKRQAEVRQNAVRFLSRDIGRLWPEAVDGKGRFRWDLLVGPTKGQSPRVGEGRIDSQYVRANVEPSDRYCLSLPGSLAARISPLDATFDNLTVAGDWTDAGFNEGCVEAAVMSGRLAAHALSLHPPLEQIVGFDHP